MPLIAKNENNAENAQGNNGNTNPNSTSSEADNSAEIAELEEKIEEWTTKHQKFVKNGKKNKAKNILKKIEAAQADLEALN